jgi:hypothetical protein
MFQLQQLGLPFGFRTQVVWWEDYLINNFHQLYENKKHPGISNCHEKSNIG